MVLHLLRAGHCIILDAYAGFFVLFERKPGSLCLAALDPGFAASPVKGLAACLG